MCAATTSDGVVPEREAEVGVQLTLVMPVYNEADAVEGVVNEWLSELDRLGLDFEIRVYDDGSVDETPRRLAPLDTRDPRLHVIRQQNRGHGPTVLRGYREARGEWVFQTDSDGELISEDFEPLWRLRAEHDFVVGKRVGRPSSPARRLVSASARGVVRALFGGPIEDVNCPYRLMRRSALAPLLAELPDAPFAPNVLLSGLAVRRGLRIAQHPVAFRGRRGGKVSLTSSRLLVGALQTARDALLLRARSRPTGR